MRIRWQPWHLALVVVLFCAGALALLRWRANRPYEDSELVSLVPAKGAILVYVNAAALRDSGILELLAGSKAAEEPEYRKFVEQIGFDYRTDLDAVAGSFLENATYFAVRGRFQWRQLATYATMQGGECRNTLCTMPGSAADRSISFYPPKPDVLAVAFSNDPKGAASVGTALKNPRPHLPSEPVWVSIPGSRLAPGQLLPAETGAFLAPLAQAREVTLAAGPSPTDKTKYLQIRLNVECASSAEAAKLREQLAHAAETLRGAVESAKGAQTSLGSLLGSGVFEQQDAQVAGRWQLDKGLLQAAFGR